MHNPPLGHKKLLTKGMHTGGMARPQRRALTASDSVPILLAVSPLAATRSAPVTTASTRPAASSAPAALSATSVAGRPSCTSSYAVSREPASSDHVGLKDQSVCSISSARLSAQRGCLPALIKPGQCCQYTHHVQAPTL